MSLLGGGAATSSAAHSSHNIPELAGPGPTHSHSHSHGLGGMGGMRPSDLEGSGLPARQQQRPMYSVEPPQPPPQQQPQQQQQDFQNPPQGYHVLQSQGGGGAPMYAVDPVYIRVAPGE